MAPESNVCRILWDVYIFLFPLGELLSDTNLWTQYIEAAHYCVSVASYTVLIIIKSSLERQVGNLLAPPPK